MTARPITTTLPTVWRVRAPAVPEEAERLASALGLPVVAAAVLVARGYRNPEQFDPPLRLSGNAALPAAAARIVAAIQAGKRIRVHGDYDADGITATSLLVRGLREAGADAHAFIPNRLTDGYGINPQRVDEHASACDLLITVDCGISNFTEVERLCAAGLEVIVTDHHAAPKDLPGCLVVHPHLDPAHVPGTAALTGAGVAFHLLWAVREALALPAPLEYADLACIGTVADVAPIVGENRAVVKAGLERLARSRWAGLKAVVAEQRLKRVTARDVAFVIAPRINAAGRLGEAELALELLTTDDPQRAAALCRELEGKNNARKLIQGEMFEQALLSVDASEAAIVVSQTHWHAGVMGIVASRLQETFNKPVFIMAGGRGSVRSLPGVSAVGALRHASDVLDHFGGHEGAAGFSLRDGAEEDFRRLILEYVAARPAPVPSVTLDALLDAREVNDAFLDGLDAAGPFGVGNEKPSFGLTGVLERCRNIGQSGAHLSFNLAGFRGVCFGAGGDGWQAGDAVNAEVALQRNEFRGTVSLEWT
ncbi:MAG TPA: single-stranded-DNA-specific exonuclease RecJ, partial [Deinococcales bacterium]|nr:single-stranded-DNA-specific exonuclease RecJ [Deinococcales bacterium]